MRILHTSDWHVGKSLRGASRLDEHREVLAEITGIARDEQVDLVLVTGDLFETAAPTPEAQRIVWDALLALRATGARVAVIGGNHDNQHALDAVAPGLERIVTHADVITPEDLETTYGMDGGHIHHGEHALDQMLVARPLLGLTGYESPVKHLFLASGGSHPGGGITGMPGLLAAGEVSRTVKRQG